jgi:hypothetical protein
MRMNKSPGAVAALGASVVDQLGRQVIPENNRQQQLPQAAIRTASGAGDRATMGASHGGPQPRPAFRTPELRSADHLGAKEFQQIAKICRRLPATMAGRDDRAAAKPRRRASRCKRAASSELAPERLIMNQEFNDYDTPSEADLDLCYGSKFLSATELGDKKIRSRILKVKKEPLRGQDGKEKNKFILSFSNLDKSLVANATNIKTLVDALGKAPSGWLNADVGIFTEPTMMAGKTTRGARLRVLGKPPSAAPAPKPPTPAPTAKEAAPWPDEPGDPGATDDFVDFGEKLE